MIDIIQPQALLLIKQSWMLTKKNLWENKENILKRRLKAKTVSVTNPDGSNVRVSNFINIIDKQHVFFINQEDLKVLNKGK